MVAKKQKVVRFNPQDIIDEQVAQIDEALEDLERRLAPYKKHLEAKAQLLAARRALLGHGPRTTGGTTTRLTLDDLVDYVSNNPGSAPGIAAEHFGVAQSTVSSHFYRNKDRFINKEGRYWVRDPKSGLNTADDIEEEEDNAA
jgi:hypothetical protein